MGVIRFHYILSVILVIISQRLMKNVPQVDSSDSFDGQLYTITKKVIKMLNNLKITPSF